ncbi:tetratricopeptide repeat protein [Malikia spinosa]|uniref:tetratricopeptide repeat protein n=1 Tax=Malikia spinosa TaxID=86180 RepID=UPI000A947135|nr:tetratricopeptide repeat protein [Malikia spinosa]
MSAPLPSVRALIPASMGRTRPCTAHQRCQLGCHLGRLAASALVALASLLPATSQAQDSERLDWLRQPALGNYKGYAEFKMGRYALARQVWETLAEVGDGEALFNLAIMAEDGLGMTRDLRKAESLYRASAQAGSLKAQYRLGLLYSDGSRFPADLEQARHYLGLAAGQGDQQAAERLATLGQPTSALTPFQQAEALASAGQHEPAARLYQQLAEQGLAAAQTRLAWMHEAGRGLPRDLEQAAQRFELAAQAGDAEAQYALAVMYRTGRGRARDLTTSMDWLRQAAAQGYPAAVAALGSFEAAQAAAPAAGADAAPAALAP